jgi:hypothetical protein
LAEDPQSPFTDIIESGTTDTPFIHFDLADQKDNPAQEVDVKLANLNGSSLTTDLGTLSNTAGGTWNASTHTFTVTGLKPLQGEVDTWLKTLSYTSPAIPAGTGGAVVAQISINGKSPTSLNSTSILEYFAIATLPVVTGAVQNQPVVVGSTITPFTATKIIDGTPRTPSVLTPGQKITVNTLENGAATDSAGTLSGNGVVKTSVGLYQIDNAADLNAAKFTPPPVAAGTARTTTFLVNATDLASNLTGTNQQNSVVTSAPGTPPSTPVPVAMPTTPTPTSTTPPLAGPTTTDTTTTPSTGPGTGTTTSTGSSFYFQVTDTSTNANGSTNADPYTGPVVGVQHQYVDLTPDNLLIAATVPNVFIHSGSGSDALSVVSGTNVLDGGTGSNFLTGGSGTDTFFVDDRGATSDIWSTMVNFHAGDSATVFGITPSTFNIAFADGQGAANFTGLTLHATAVGKATASLTLVGYTSADLNNGRLTISYGTESDGSTYASIQGH